jgi:uncharacterized protein with FMN-binding domain
MKKIVYSILATIAGLVLLFSYRTSLDETIASSPVVGKTTFGTGTGPSGGTGSAPAATPSASAAPPQSNSNSSNGSSGSSSSGSSGSSNSSSGLKNGTFTGQAADTPYGPVQVSITISGGSITAVNVPQYPNSGGRDREINSYALPQLVQETGSAQSAQIDMVSGATYTSQGYIQSLQSAIDQARA